MQSVLCVFAFLAACVIATPLDLAPRYLPGLPSTSVSSSHKDSTRASSSFQGGPGGFSSNSFYRHSSKDFYQTSTVLNTFGGLGNEIANFQSLLASGSINQQIAYERMSRLANSFQIALNQGTRCGSCFSSGPDFTSGLSSTFTQFQSLLISLQTRFRSSFGNICAPLAPVGPVLQSFFRYAQNSGYYSSNLLSGRVSPVWAQVPGFRGIF